jgi:hypothetical protein
MFQVLWSGGRDFEPVNTCTPSTWRASTLNFLHIIASEDLRVPREEPDLLKVLASVRSLACKHARNRTQDDFPV